MLEREASLILKGEDQGLSQLLNSVTKSSINLNKEVLQTGSQFVNLGESIPHQSLELFGKTSKNSIGGLTKLDRSLRGVGGSYGSLIDKTEKASQVLDGTNNLFVKLGASSLGYGKTLEGVNTILEPAAGFWNQYSAASSGAGKALLLAKTAGQGLNPVLDSSSKLAIAGAKNLESMGGAASSLAKPLEGIAKTMQSTERGLKVAGIASDVSQLVDKVNEFKDETLPELQEELSSTLEALDQMGVKNMLFGSTMKTATTAATVLSATTKGLTKSSSDTFLQFSKFLEIKGYMAIVAGAISEVDRIVDDTYRSVEEFEALGIDTSMQKNAMAVGYFGEKLLFSTEAAKKFRLEAVGAFIQLQDQLAYLTTLSSAAAQGQDLLGESILSMVDGPLKNSVSAMEAATGYYDAISAGQTSVDFLNASFKYSAATGAAATDSIGALAQVHNIYSINARDSAKTAALFNSTVENGVLNGAQMASGIGQLASTAKSAGIDLVELNAMLAALTKNGFSAPDAFQGLMSLITSIAGQGSESAKAAQELGIGFNFARIKAEGLMKPINELYSAANGSDSRIKTIIPDALAYRTAIALATGASKDFVAIQDQMQNLDANSLDVVFERRRDSVLQRTQELQEGFKTEMIRFGEDMQETMTPAIAASEHLLEAFRGLPEPAKDLIILASKSGIAVEKLEQSGSVLLGVVQNLGKAFLVYRASTFLPFGAGAGRLAGLVDLVKNQKDYTGALQTFLGVSDNVSEKIKHLTGIEKSQFLTNQKLLNQRRQSITELAKGEQIGGINLFAENEKAAQKSIKKSFANAAPVAKQQAEKLRTEIFAQFTDFKDGSNKSNLIIRELGLDRIKDTEQELAQALERIRAKKEEGFEDKPRSDREGYLERLTLVEDNIQKRQELLSLSKSQLELEQQGVASLQAQIASASATVKGSMAQGKQLVIDAIASKGELLTQIRQVTVSQLDEIDASIRQQILEMSPQFAGALADKTGAELETALGSIQNNLELPDPKVDRLAQTLESRKALVEASKQQIAVVREEGKALTAAASGRKLDLIERTKATEAIAKEMDVRQNNIKLLQKNNEIDFLQIIGDEDIKEKIQAGFATADGELKERIKELAVNLQADTEAIFENKEAFDIADLIGLGEVKNSLTSLEEVRQKLLELKELGGIDPQALAMVEENLNQRTELAIATAAETAALRVQTASLAQQTAVLGANNLARAQQIGFTGILAGANTKLAATYFAVTSAINGNSAANSINTLGMKANLVATKLLGVAKLGWAAATTAASGALSKLWLSLGPIGLAVIGLTAAFAGLMKVRGHIKMLEETREATNKLLNDSENFKQQLTMASDLKSFARELGEYNQEAKQALVDAQATGVGVAEAQEKVTALADLNVQSLSKTTDTYDTLNQVGMDGYIDQLDKTSVALVDYNSAADKAFDSVVVNKMVTQSRAAIDTLKELADNARLAGDNLEAIRLDRLAGKAEKFANSGESIQAQFEGSLSREQLDEYKKNKAKLLKEQEKFDREALKVQGRISQSEQQKRIREMPEVFGLQEQTKKQMEEQDKGNDVYKTEQKILKQTQTENSVIEAQIARAKKGEILSAANKVDDFILGDKKQELDKLKAEGEAKLKIIEESNSRIAELKAKGLEQTGSELRERDGLKARVASTRKELSGIVADRDAAQEQYNKLLANHDSFNRSEEIIKAAKANKTGAAFTAEAFKEIQQVEKEALDQASQLSDRHVKNLESELERRKERGQITTTGIAEMEAEIQKLRELSSAREEAYKNQDVRLKETQAALAAMDLNNAAVSEKDLVLQNNRARAKIVAETVSETTKATQDYKDFMKSVEEDSNNMLKLPEAYKTASLAAFDEMNKSMEQGINASTSYQRRQIAIATNGLAELATNIDITEEKGLEAARGAVDKAIENVQILQASGALSPKAIAAMYEQIGNITTKIGLVGKEGSIMTAAQIDAIFDGQLASEQEYVNRLVEVNRQAIEQINHLEAVALLTDHEAQAEKLSLEIQNNDLIYNAAKTRYEKLAATRGADTKESLEAYGEMLAAQRNLEVSEFQAKQAEATRELELATAKLNLEVDKTILGYNQELDALELVSNELERQEKLISVYNDGLNTSLTFLDDILKAVGATVKNEKVAAQLGEKTAKRNLEILKLQQKQELETQKRLAEQNRLKALDLAFTNDIAIAEKDREIQLAKWNFETESSSRKLRDDEIAAFEMKLKNMERERSLLATKSEELLKNYEAEKSVSEESYRQLELKQEQARSNGVLDVIGSKLDQITAKYKEQESVNSALNESFQARSGYVDTILGAISRVTTNEKEQQRLAQIAAQTKLKLLERQQEMERRTLEIQQAQQASLLQQEKIKLKLLTLQQKAAIAEDTSKLIEAKSKGDEQAVKSLTAVLATRFEILGTSAASEKSIDQQLKYQQQLNALERQNLGFKQQGEAFNARVDVNNARPDGYKKRQEAKRLQREGLDELGLSRQDLKRRGYKVPTADLPPGASLPVPQEIDVQGIIKQSADDFFNQLGIVNPLAQDNTLEREFTQVKNQAFPVARPKTLLDYVDPAQRQQFQQQYYDRDSVNKAAPVGIPTISSVPTASSQVKVNSSAVTPTAQPTINSLGVSNESNLLNILQAQLETQKQLVSDLQKQKSDMYNDININVADASVGADEIGDIFLDKFDSILSQAEARRS